LDPTVRQHLRWAKFLGAGVLLCVFVWAYWPTLAAVVATWNREPDYSHGFLVVPLAALFLWARRDRMPEVCPRVAWAGLSLLAAAVLVRIAAGAFYVDSLDGWSIVFWVAGVVWLLGGARLLVWSLPSIAFLWFAVPIPFRAERLLSQPLQAVAAKLSCCLLQCLGQPALVEGNTVLLGNHQLAVEEACSGLRILISALALGVAYVIVVRRSWWQKGLLLLSVVPIALCVNALRIVATGLLQQHVSGQAAARFAHDFAGWSMIVLAALLFAFVLWNLTKLFPLVVGPNIQTVVHQERN
jgi:exosortase